jgi:amiloride-sensitive sodium channel
MYPLNPVSKDNFKWKGHKGNNAFYFTNVMTDIGYCPSFNLLKSSVIFKYNSLDRNYTSFGFSFDDSLDKTMENWSPETGYTDDSSFKTYPLRSRESDANTGFQLRLSLNGKDLKVACESGTEGYKILIHPPTDWPYMSKNFLQISHNQKYTIVLKPQIITTSPTLESYNYAE